METVEANEPSETLEVLVGASVQVNELIEPIMMMQVKLQEIEHVGLHYYHPLLKKTNLCLLMVVNQQSFPKVLQDHHS